jgi:uncharacterized protein
MPGTLEHFLTERYCLYAQGRAGLTRVDVHHAPWQLQEAEATIGVNSMAMPFGVRLDARPTLLHFARRVDVVIWPRLRLTV